MSYDQYFFPYVVSLLNMEGIPDGTNFADMNGARVWSRTSAPVTKQTIKKFGAASGYFNGSSYISCPASEDFNFGTGAFTIEAWVYVAANSATDGGGIRDAVICSTMSTNFGGFAFGVLGDASTTGTGIWWEDKNGSNISGSWATTVSQSNWHHICVVRENANANLLLGLDGTLQTSAITGGSSRVLGANAYPMWIGAQNVTSWSRYLNGYIDDFRITKGIARYTGSSYTVPTEALVGWKQNPITMANRVDAKQCKTQLMTNPLGVMNNQPGRLASVAFASVAVDLGTISGTITEELAFSKWKFLICDAVTGEYLGTRKAAGSSYSIRVARNHPVLLTCIPDIDGRWKAQTPVVVDELWIPTNAIAKPYAYRCTTAGRTGSSEPSWGTTPGGTTSDGTAVWTCLSRLPPPVTQGPLVAA